MIYSRIFFRGIKNSCMDFTRNFNRNSKIFLRKNHQDFLQKFPQKTSLNAPFLHVSIKSFKIPPQGISTRMHRGFLKDFSMIFFPKSFLKKIHKQFHQEFRLDSTVILPLISAGNPSTFSTTPPKIFSGIFLGISSEINPTIPAGIHPGIPLKFQQGFFRQRNH